MALQPAGASVHYLIVGFLVMLGALAAVASAPMIFAVAIGAMKLLLLCRAIGAARRNPYAAGLYRMDGSAT
jgi:hypothetical protein